MTIFYVFKIILLNEHFPCRQLGVLLAFGCQLALGKGCLPGFKPSIQGSRNIFSWHFSSFQEV